MYSLYAEQEKTNKIWTPVIISNETLMKPDTRGRFILKCPPWMAPNTISSSEFRKVLSPRQRLGVFNNYARPSRHLRSQGDQACSRGFRVTSDPRLGHLGAFSPNALFPEKNDRKNSPKWTKRRNEGSPASRKMNLAPINIQATICPFI